MLASCSLPAAAPIDTAQPLQALQQRRLDDPRLRRFIEAAQPAQAARSPARWDLQRLTLAALYFHPDLPIARSELDIAHGQAVTARARPNPGIVATLGRGAGDFFTSPWIVGAAIDLLVQPGDRRATRVAAADASVRAARAALRQASWSVRARVYGAWLDVWSAQRRLDALRDELELQSQRAQLFARRVEAGESARAELRRELIQREQLAAAAAQAQEDLARARVDLAEAVGVPTPALDAIALAVDSLDSVPALDEGLLSDAARGRALAARADVLDALARVDVAQAELQAAASRRWPDLRLAPGYLFDQGNDRYEVTAALDWPASIEGPLAEALARRDLAARRLLGLQARILARIDRAAAEWAAATQRSHALEELLERQQQHERAAQAGLDAGSLDRPSWLAARIDLLEAQRALAAAHERQRRALAALEDALQQPVEPGEELPFPPEDA